MSQFSDSADRLTALVGEGLTLTAACERISLSYSTARGWVTAGRRNPDGPYGAFSARLEKARTSSAPKGEDQEPGPVEGRVEQLLANATIQGEAAVAAEQARVLARKVDQLALAPGGSAGLALASVSRRLEECVSALHLPEPKDALDELLEARARRLGGLARQGRPGGPASNGGGASQ